MNKRFKRNDDNDDITDKIIINIPILDGIRDIQSKPNVEDHKKPIVHIF